MSQRAAVVGALLMVLSACTVDSSYGGAGFACSDTEPCQAGFDCKMGICEGGAGDPDARPGDSGPGDPDAAEIVCLPPIAVSDQFPGDTLDAQWTAVIGSGTSIVVADGVLTLTPRLNSVPERVASVRSQAFALEGMRAFAEIPAMVNPTTTAFGEFQLASQTNSYYFLRQSQGILQFGTTIAGTELILAATDYDPVGHRWWQMRMTGGRLYADVSADGSIWVNLDSALADVIVGDLYLELSAGTRESIATPGAMQVDNVNAGSGLCL